MPVPETRTPTPHFIKIPNQPKCALIPTELSTPLFLFKTMNLYNPIANLHYALLYDM